MYVLFRVFARYELTAGKVKHGLIKGGVKAGVLNHILIIVGAKETIIANKSKDGWIL